MNIIVFPGQGSQKIGMGKELSDNFPEAKQVFEEVNDALNFNLTRVMWDGTDKEIALTSNAQPALMACSIATLRVLNKITNKNLSDLACYVCGHSLGEYSAMTAAEVFSISQCATLLRLRGDAMQKAVPIGKGAMAALIGTNIEMAVKVIDKVKSYGVCDIANDNSQGQVVISGDILAVENAMKFSKDFGIKKAILLPVSAPFHCKLMRPAQIIMEKALNKLNFKTPLIPIISNVNVLPENNPDKLRKNLIDQVTGTVRWRETMEFAEKKGIKKIIELGSGKVLTGIAKRMIKDIVTINIENTEDFKNFI
ncbi:ACP S-malonyltransferase [Alphaproteobacteria bacterium]|nr:ACP S-malonyltransferase [Alphaproteobacteria bacterium]